MRKKGYNKDTMSSKHKLFNTQILLLIIILGLAFIFRFYRLNDWLIFGMDQENEALIIQNILSGKHFPAIGLSISDTGVYRGPFILYLFAIIQAIFRGNPIGGAVVASLLGIITTFTVYIVGKKMYSQRVGFFASFFYGSSFLISYYDRQFWNPSLIPLMSILIGFCIYRILKGNLRIIPFTFFLFGISLHAHISVMIFFPLIIMTLFKKRREIPVKFLILSLLLFLITQIPLIIFDLRHNFINTKAILSLFSGSKNAIIQHTSISERLILSASTLGRVVALPPEVDLFVESGQCKELLPFRKNPYPELIVLAIGGIGIFRVKFNRIKQLSDKNVPQIRDYTAKNVLFLIFLLTAGFILFYNRQLFEYYFLYLFPWISIVFGLSLDFMWQKEFGKFVAIPILFLFLILNLYSLYTASYSYSFKDKRDTINFVKNNLHTSSYTLEALGECPRFGGYRYLFEYYIGVPSTSYMDSYFAWLYPEKIKGKKAEKIVLLSMIDDRLQDSTLKKWQEEKLQFLMDHRIEAENRFGKIHIYILSTSI